MGNAKNQRTGREVKYALWTDETDCRKVGPSRNFKGFPKMKIKESKYKNGVIELWDALKGTIRMPGKKRKMKRNRKMYFWSKNIPELMAISKADIQEMERLQCILTTQTCLSLHLPTSHKSKSREIFNLYFNLLLYGFSSHLSLALAPPASHTPS